MAFKLKKFENGGEQEVEFDFDMEHDTPSGVAQEMVDELHLHKSQVDQIAKQIEQFLYKRRLAHASGARPPHHESQPPKLEQKKSKLPRE